MPARRLRYDSRIKVSVTPEQRARIESCAAMTSLSVSAYLRTLGMTHEPKSTLDDDAIRLLAKLHGDLGRLGGLLKLWLSERPGQGAPTSEVRLVLRGFEQLQRDVKDVVKQL